MNSSSRLLVRYTHLLRPKTSRASCPIYIRRQWTYRNPYRRPWWNKTSRSTRISCSSRVWNWRRFWTNTGMCFQVLSGTRLHRRAPHEHRRGARELALPYLSVQRSNYFSNPGWMEGRQNNLHISTDSTFPYASLVLLVSMGTGEKRLLVDFRLLNQQTVQD